MPPAEPPAVTTAPTIRATAEEDRVAVLDLVRRAFTDDSRDGSDEVAIVERTWASAAPGTIDLVAVLDGEAVGHVLAAPGAVAGTPLLGLAPLAADPGHQRRGVGSALMAELLRRAAGDGWPAVVLLGHPDYYPRFGFEPAARWGVVYPPVGPDSPAFQLCRLGDDRSIPRGDFSYLWELP